MIDGDLFPGAGVIGPPFGQIYLKSNFDFLREGSRREDGLHLGHDCGRDHTAVRTDGVHLLSDPRHDGEILWEIRRQDPSDPVRVHVLQLT